MKLEDLMKKELFEAVGQCCLCEIEHQMIQIIGKKGICEDCLRQLIELIDKRRRW